METKSGTPPRDRADVVVVGGGVAGLLAAIDAADAGADVVLLEKNSDIGGKSRWSVGDVAAGDTSVQAAAGVEDSADKHRDDIFEHAGKLGTLDLPGLRQKLKLLIANVGPAINRLTDLGLEFGGPHPLDGHSVYRGHMLLPNTMGFVDQLGLVARQHGVRIRRDTRVESILQDENGTVVGVSAGGREILASAVILSAGDHSAAESDRTPPPFADHAFKSWSTGDGQYLAGKAGAEVLNPETMPFAALTTIDTPSYFGHPVVLFGGGVVLTASGARVANEMVTMGVGYADATDEDLYILIGGKHIERLATAEEDGPMGRDGWLRTGKTHLGDFESVGYAYEKDLVDAGFARRYESLDDLAADRGINIAQLRREVDDVVAAQRDGKPDRVGREWPEVLIESGPYLWIGPFRGVLVLGSTCVSCDDEMRALDAGGAPIEGLYVAGDTADAANVFFAAGSHGYGLAWAFVTGRIAGAQAAARATS